MELWQIAAVLGLARTDEPDGARPAVRAHDTVDGTLFTPAAATSVDRIKRRLAEAETDG